MARTRNIKPSFFKNENLAELDPLARLLFAGLWTIADKEGRLEDRPKRIKAEILPYDDCGTAQVHGWLQDLHERNFILRYEIDGNGYISVPSWAKHQRPHHKELDSEIPEPTPTQVRASTDLGASLGVMEGVPNTHPGTCEHAPKSGRVPLEGVPNPPLTLNPSTLNPSTLNQSPAPARKRPREPTMTEEQERWFAEWWAGYWRPDSKKAAKEAFGRHVKTKERFVLVMLATTSQRPRMMARELEKRPYGATWLNGERWEDSSDQRQILTPPPPSAPKRLMLL